MLDLKKYNKKTIKLASFPVSLLWLVTVIGITEFLIMLALSIFTLSSVTHAILDSLILAIVISPVLYLYIAKRRRAEEALMGVESRLLYGKTPVMYHVMTVLWLVIIIGIAEFLIMFLLPTFVLSDAGRAILDSLILAVLISPVLYLYITKRKRIEENLKESERKYRELIDTANDAVVVVEPTGNLSFVNPKFCELTGYSMEEAKKLHFSKLVHPEDLTMITENFRKRMAGEEVPRNYEFRALTKTGETIYVDLNTSIIEREGKIVGILDIIRDITERKRMEDRIRQQNVFLNDILESLPHPFYVIDADDYTIKLANSSARQGKTHGILTCYALTHRKSQPCGDEEHVCPLEEVKKTKKPVTVEHIHHDKDGNPRNVEVHSYPIFDDKRNVIQMIEYCLDITERKKMEQRLAQKVKELQDAYQELQELNQMKDSFLSTVSHELRTPLTSIKGFAEILLNYEEDRKTETEFLTIINEESDRLTRLIDDLLDLSRIESGRMRWENVQLAIPEVIKSAVEATHALSAQKNLRIDIHMEPNLPTIWADKDKLVQVVTNLLGNAIKFTPEGGEIRVGAQFLIGNEAEDISDMIKLSVSDSGIGIAVEDHEIIFEKFQQAGDTLTDKPKGTGLGLAISKEIVEHYGGMIWVESSLGKGSTFHFTLPVVKRTETEVPKAGPESAKVTPRMKKLILVVDDEANIRRFLNHEFTSRGYQVIEASGGQEAIKLAAEHHPDLITLDVLMPDIDGFDVTAVLKADPDTRDIPILILSVLEEREKGNLLGVSDYVTKPFNKEKLMDKITRLLGEAQKTVLVADDDKSLVKAIKFELEKRGFSVYVAYDGDEALKVVESKRPDLIVLDILMPRVDGYTVMKLLKENPDSADIPIIVLTGVDIDGGRVQALSLGATEYVTKSEGLKKLFENIDNIFGGKPGN